jgi:hypothetical protein
MTDQKERHEGPRDDPFADTRARAREPYARPSLTEHGSITTLTRCSGATSREGESPRMRAL